MRLAILMGAALLSAAAGTAAAQEGGVDDELAAARAAFDDASEQFRNQNYQLALEGFERTYEMMGEDNPRRAALLFNIGRSYEELGRWQEALQHFERFLIEAPQDLPMRPETQNRVRELRARIAAQAAAEPVPVAEPDSSPLIPVGVAVAAIGAAAALAAIVPGVMALDGESELASACPDGVCAADRAGQIDEVQTLAVTADVLWIAGASLLAVGAALFAVGLASEGGGDVEASAACNEHGCVAVARGRF